jgi:L-malate glycosyltransferase
MKKLLLVGGGSIHLKNFYDLVSGYFQSTLIITNENIYDYTNAEIFIASFSIRNPFLLVRNIKAIRKKIIEFAPDIIHIHQASTYSFLTIKALGKLKIPIIITAWGGDILVIPNKSILLRKMVKYDLKHAQAYTSDSLYMSEEIKKLTNTTNKPLITVNFGVDLPTESLDKKNIIYSNRLHKDFYRIDKIINAFNLFSEKNPDWKLIIAGEGDETDKLKKMAAQCKYSSSIEFVGWVDKNTNQSYYNQAKYFVSVPTTDATSVSLLESMASGCIPIVSDLQANREWVQNGINGIIVNDVNTDFISVASFLNDDNCKDYNRKLIIENASKDASRKKFYGLYDRLLR